MERFEDKVKVIDFAQMAMDCYNSSKDDEFRKGFNELWRKVDQYPKNSWGMARDIGKPSTADEDQKTGFYSNFYINTSTNVGVMAIRGTDSLVDQIVDVTYVLDKSIEQYDQALSYFGYLQKRFSNVKKFYVCGHSLGGIVSKMIFPKTKVNTIAFNSPGVVEYLNKMHKPCTKSASSDAMCMPILDPMALTFCANGCPIGNLRHDNDVGPYKWLPVQGEARIPDSVDRIGGTDFTNSVIDIIDGEIHGDKHLIDQGLNEMPEFVKVAFENKLKYHSMRDMYTSLINSNYKNDRI